MTVPPPIRKFALVAALALVVTACGNSRAGQGPPPPAPEGPRTEAMREISARIKGSGASFPDAFYQEAVYGLGQAAPKLSITYEAVGSAAGREAFANGLNDFAGTDSLVGDDESLDPGAYRYIPAISAPIAVVANVAGAEELRLDAETLADIFQTRITRWNDPAIAELNPDLDLPATRIVVARRSDGAGTTKNFTRYLETAAPDTWKLGSGDTVEWPAATQGGQQNAGVAQLVQDTDGGIGYLDLGNALELGLEPIALRNRAGRFVRPDVASSAAAVASVDIAADLTLDPLDAPGADAYPITAVTYILVRPDYPNGQRGRAVTGFVGWLLTEGADTYAAELGYAPLPEAVREASLDALAQIEVG